MYPITLYLRGYTTVFVSSSSNPLVQSSNALVYLTANFFYGSTKSVILLASWITAEPKLSWLGSDSPQELNATNC